MTPTNVVTEFPVQKTVFDLDNFEEVTIAKTYTYTPVASVQDALQRLGNDSVKLLSVVNDGLRSEALRSARASADGWMVEDEDGTTMPFSGTLANLKIVNQLVLSMAKTVFGFAKDSSKEDKRKAKDSARELIRTNPTIRDGLTKSAASQDIE